MLNLWRAHAYRFTFKMTGGVTLPTFGLPARLMPMHNFLASCT